MKKNSNKVLKNIQSHLLTGVSYMMPVIIIAGVTMGTTSLLASVFFDVREIGKVVVEADTNAVLAMIAWCYSAGSLLMGMMYPVLSAYIAFSIADRPGIAPGILGGLLTVNLNTGFMGAVLTGFVAGYSIVWLNKEIKVPRQYIGVKAFFLLPVLSTLIMLFVSKFGISYIGIGFTNLSNWAINSVGDAGGAIISAALGAARAFDFGGPVNKMAGVIGKQLYADTGFSYIALVLGALVAPIGIGLSPFFARLFTKKDIVDPVLKANQVSTLTLGFLGLSEAVLPYIIADPFIIPITMVSTAVAGALGFVLGASVFPGGIYGIYMWPLINNVGGFLIALGVGVLLVCVLMYFHRMRIYNKKNKATE